MTVRAVFFDFMGTLARFVPEQEDLLVEAAARADITLTQQAARRGFSAAGDWWNRQMALLSLNERLPEERETLYREFDQRVLQAAGITISEEAAYQIFRELLRQGHESRLAAFDDVVPALVALQQREVRLGVISNSGQRLLHILADLGLDTYFDTVVTSGEVGITKPQPGIFHMGLERAGVAPDEALYVGDQYQNDVVGARSAGLVPILVDRYDLLGQHTDCLRVRSLAELPQHLNSGP